MPAAAIAIALTLLALADDAPPAKPPDDKARLQGVWTMAENIVNGFKANDRQLRSWVLVIEGDQYNPGAGELSMEYTFRLRPDESPGAIDITATDGPERGKTFRGIYTLEGDTFTLCRALDPAVPRPKTFDAPAGSGRTRVVWKRRKRPEPRPTPPVSPPTSRASATPPSPG